MFWSDKEDAKDAYRVPEDVFDLVFKMRGTSLAIDHAFALSEALQTQLGAEICNKIGVHGVGMAGTGNGWNRPDHADAELPLPRRARMAIRVHSDQADAVAAMTDRALQLGSQEITVGESTVRKLSTMGTLHARAVRCERDQSEADFLTHASGLLRAMDIRVSKMMCGKSGEIRTDGETLFTRALLVADLEPEEAVVLQRQGLGDGRLLGCGLFVPHRGIDPVYNAQEQE